MKSFPFERKCIQWICRRWMEIIVFSAVIFSLFVRYQMRNFESADMAGYLLPWYLESSSYPGTEALGHQVGDYMPSFQLLVWLFTKIPMSPLHLYKMLSTLFDFLLAGGIAQLVWMGTSCRKKSLAAFAVSILFPVFLLNSCMWGQSDSIYSFFCVLCFILLKRGKITGSFIAYGCAFAFKLQSVFLLPFLLFSWLREQKFSLLNFLWIPVTMALWCLPALLQGRSVGSILDVYFLQVEEESSMISCNYPSFWNLSLQINSTAYYIEMKWAAISVCMMLLMGEIALLLNTEKKLALPDDLAAAQIMLYTCVFFLPAMHDHHGYMVLVFSLILAFLDIRKVPVLLILMFLDLRSYGQYLFNAKPWWPGLTVVNLIGWCLCMALFARQIQGAGKRSGFPPASVSERSADTA